MAEQTNTRLWLMRLAFVVSALLTMYWQLLPLQTTPRGWAGPDVLVLLCVSWVLRRPEYAPAILIAGLVLLADLVFLRAPGLFAMVVLLVCENLRKRSEKMRDMPFSVEWLTAAAALATITIIHRVLASAFVVDQAPLGLALMQLIANVVAYPLVAFTCYLLLGLRKPSPHELDTLKSRA